MTEKQRDLVAIVFDMKLGQLQAAMYQIILGDPVEIALDKARAKPSHYKKQEQQEIFK